MNTLKKNKIKTGIFILLLLLITILFHSIEFRVAVWNIDEFIFSTGGQKILAGGTLYRDFGDNKPPLIYYTYAMLYGLSDGNYHSFLIISKLTKIAAVFLTALGLFYIGKSLKDRTLGIVSSLLFAAYSICAQSSEVLGGRTEIYATLMTTISICFFARKRFAFSIIDLLASGFFLSLATLYNTRFGIIVVVYSIFIFYKEKITIRSFLNIAALSIFLLISLAAVPLYYYQKGVFDSYTFWQSTVFKYYLTAFPFYKKIASGFLVLIFLAGIAPVAIFSIYALVRISRNDFALKHPPVRSFPAGKSNRSGSSVSWIFAGMRGIAAWSSKNEMYVFLVIMIVCMYLAFFAGGIPGMRYFYMLFIPLCVLAAQGFIDIYCEVGQPGFDKYASRLCKIILIIFLILPPSYFYIIHWHTQRPMLFENANRYKLVVKYIKNNTEVNDTIYVWYNVGPLYLYSNRSMATSMVYPGEFLFRNYYFTGDFQREATAWDIFLTQLKNERPALIIDDSGGFSAKKESTIIFNGKNEYAKKKTGEMRAFISKNYTYVKTLQGLKIYKRLSCQETVGIEDP